MKIDLQVDDKALATLKSLGEKKLPYAAVNALNQTAKQLQKQMRIGVKQRFRVRPKRQAFFLRMAAIIKPFASVKKGIAFAEIAVGQKPKLLLSKFERGFKRLPFTPGAKHVAVPLTGGPARPRIGSSVPPEFTFRRLRLKQAKKKGGKRKTKTEAVTFTQTKRGQWKGRQRTFILTHTAKAPLGGVFQRIGPKRGDIRMVYSFSDPRWVKARLRFMQTVSKRGARFLAVNFRNEVEKAMIRAVASGKTFTK